MKEIVIVASKMDPAGTNIARSLIDLYGFDKTSLQFEGNPVFQYERMFLVFSSKDIIWVEKLDENFSPSFYLFVSRHRSESGIPSLTAHFTGNFTRDASFGGSPNELSYTYPSILKEYLVRISENSRKLEKYHVVLEATHHGPTSLKKPVVFVELGSTLEEWSDMEAAMIIAKTIMQTLQAEPSYIKIGIGFGGTHYSTKFTDYLLKSDVALGAVAPKYVLDDVDAQLVRQMIEKSVEKVTHAVLEWKGLGRSKDRILDLVNASGLTLDRI